MKKLLKFGVIGLGFGATVHVPALQSIKDVKVSAIAGRNLVQAKFIASKFKVLAAFDNLEDFFKQELDAVTIALPPVEAEKAILMALKKGLPVLTEKPLSVSLKSAKKIAKHAKGNIVGIDFQFAELDVFKRLKEIIDSKKFGDVRHVQIVWMVNSDAHRNKKWSWKVDSKRGGGVVSLLGSHLFYLIEWLFGPVLGLYASASAKSTASFSPLEGVPADDFASMIFNHPKVQHITATISNATSFGVGHRWEIALDTATVILHNSTFDYMNGFVLSVNYGKKNKMLLSQKKDINVDGRLLPFKSLAERFVASINSRTEMKPNFVDGIRVQHLMDAVYRSAKTCRYVKCK